jgi:hypothetical protein
LCIYSSTSWSTIEHEQEIERNKHAMNDWSTTFPLSPLFRFHDMNAYKYGEQEDRCTIHSIHKDGCIITFQRCWIHSSCTWCSALFIWNTSSRYLNHRRRSIWLQSTSHNPTFTRYSTLIASSKIFILIPNSFFIFNCSFS